MAPIWRVWQKHANALRLYGGLKLCQFDLASRVNPWPIMELPPFTATNAYTSTPVAALSMFFSAQKMTILLNGSGYRRFRPRYPQKFHLLKNSFYFPVLVFKGIYHHWICFIIFFQGSQPLGNPVVPFYPFFGEGSPTKIDQPEKGNGTNLF